MDLEQVRRYYNKVLRPLCTIQSSFSIYQRAFALREQSSISWYDSLVVAGALEGACKTLYTEDMQDGRHIEGLEIRNPF